MLHGVLVCFGEYGWGGFALLLRASRQLANVYLKGTRSDREPFGRLSVYLSQTQASDLELVFDTKVNWQARSRVVWLPF